MWCLGRLGLRPEGAGLGGWLGERLAGEGAPHPADYEAQQLRWLLLGVVECGVVLPPAWTAELLQYAADRAEELPVEV